MEVLQNLVEKWHMQHHPIPINVFKVGKVRQEHYIPLLEIIALTNMESIKAFTHWVTPKVEVGCE